MLTAACVNGVCSNSWIKDMVSTALAGARHLTWLYLYILLNACMPLKMSLIIILVIARSASRTAHCRLSQCKSHQISVLHLMCKHRIPMLRGDKVTACMRCATACNDTAGSKSLVEAALMDETITRTQSFALGGHSGSQSNIGIDLQSGFHLEHKASSVPLRGSLDLVS